MISGGKATVFWLCLGIWTCGKRGMFGYSPVEFLDVSLAQNPWNRDTDLLPAKPDDKGSEAADGKLRFLLTTSFISGALGTGKVWVIPISDPLASFVLVSGLDTPTGLCFDKNHSFLYVTDPNIGAAPGRVLQFSIDTDLKSRFVLSDYTVATVYTGPSPFDCSVDSYGNLYLADSQTNAIDLVAYLDLWSGFVGQQTTLYIKSDGNRLVSAPVAVEVQDSTTVFFLNNDDPEDAGLLNEAPARSKFLNEAKVRSDVRVQRKPWGLALAPSFAYYTTDDGNVWAYHLLSPNLYLKSSRFSRPRGLCYSHNSLYVADNAYGEVFRIKAGKDEDWDPQGVVRIEGVYEVYCVNA